MNIYIKAGFQFQFHDFSTYSIPIPIPVVSIPIPIPGHDENFNSNSNSRIGIGIESNSNSKPGIDPMPGNNYCKMLECVVMIWCVNFKITWNAIFISNESS